MARLTRRARCSSCGAAVPSDAGVCSGCGAPIQPARTTYRCASCGARVPVGEACPICGVRHARRDWSRLIRFAGLAVAAAALLAVGVWAWPKLNVGEVQMVMGPTATATNSPYPTWTPSPTPTLMPTATNTPPASATPSPMPSAEPTAVLTAVPTAVPTAAPSATPGNATYQVVAGDSPIAIARRFGMDVQALLDLNGLGSNPVLRVDQELLITQGDVGGPQPTATALAQQDSATVAPTPTAEPTATETPTPTATPGMLVHVVAPGDMLGSLAVAYDVDSEAIAAANKIALTAILHVGQELLIPGMTPTPSVTPTATVTPTPTDAATPWPTIPPRPAQLAFPYRSPMLLAPTDGKMLRGVDTDVVLNWTSVGILSEDEWYQVTLDSPCLSETSHHWTRATSWRLPAELYCQDPDDTVYTWSVSVVYRTDPSLLGMARSAPSKSLRFYWQP